MALTTLSSRAFNQDVTKAKRASNDGPVFITVRGTPAHVLLSMEQYQRITQQQSPIADLIAMDEDVDFEPGRLDVAFKPAAFD